ncbi:MAG: zinc metallopeptidase [bacterium]
MFFFDPAYMVIGLIGMAISFIPQTIVKNTYGKFLKVNTRNNMTGKEVAEAILSNSNIKGISIEAIDGELSDHYDPNSKTVRLSRENYYGTSVSSVSVAAHEIGHVIQDHVGYQPMKLRAGIVPLVNMTQSLAPMLIMGSLLLRGFLHSVSPEFYNLIAFIGVLLYGGSVLFHVVTLPVEFNASNRAILALSNGGFIQSEEVVGARKVLNAAALTYVATALYSLIELLYWAWILFGRGRDD